jgi:hypothetical protein
MVILENTHVLTTCLRIARICVTRYAVEITAVLAGLYLLLELARWLSES